MKVCRKRSQRALAGAVALLDRHLNREREGYQIAEVMKTCSYCGRESEDEMVRCAECGSDLNAPEGATLSLPPFPRRLGVLLTLTLVVIAVAAVMRIHFGSLSKRALEIHTTSVSSGICSIHQIPLQTRTAYFNESIIHFKKRVHVCYKKWPNAIPLIYSKSDQPSPGFPYETTVFYCPTCDEEFMRCVEGI
jgi:hypothetical protein